MRILCCLDGTNFEQIDNVLQTVVPNSAPILGFIHVIDTRPQREMEQRIGPLLRRAGLDTPRMEKMRQAEQEAAQEVLMEAHAHYPAAETLYCTGQPERVVVNFAAEWRADLIVLCPRSPQSGGPLIGPKSIGHIARFIVDHAPCPVLLVRTRMREGFPLREKK